MRIVFMGTPDFAVASLQVLIEAGVNVVAVVTAPDKPAGRGQKLSESAVKRYASEHGLRVLQPERLKSPEFIAELKELKADLQIVVAFRMLPEVVWNMPPRGTINLHASLLPQYRGAAPINWAIMNGETVTGVSTFFLKHEIDTGDLLLTREVGISPTDTAGDLHDKLMHTGAEVLLETVRMIAKGSYSETPQTQLAQGQVLKSAPKIFRDDCRINWHSSAAQVYNFIRGLSPYPTAYTLFDQRTLKIFRADISEPIDVQPGDYLTDGRTFLKFACTDGSLDLKEVQLEGKKRMGIEEFLRGVRPVIK